MSEPLIFDRHGPIAVITLNRPARHNALTPELICRLADAFDTFEADPALRVAILTGAGDRSFCVGGDLELTLPLLTGARAPQTKWDHRLVENREILFRSTFKGVQATKPVIAAVNGYCLAGGFEMMLSADIRIATDQAQFGLPEAQHALIPFAGALVRLPRQLPHAVAMEMLLTGDQMQVDRLYTLGLINRVVPSDQLMQTAMSVAERIAANGPIAIADIKRITFDAIGQTFNQGFALETEAMDRVMATQDAREGPQAFMERRKPEYAGQ